MTQSAARIASRDYLGMPGSEPACSDNTLDGVPPHLVEDTFAVAAQFFARPEPDKLALKIGKYNIGYLPFGGQIVRHSPVNRNTRPNFSESFYITRDRAPDHPDIVDNKPLVGLK